MGQVTGTGRGSNLRSNTSRKVTFAVGLLCVLVAAALTTLSPSAEAATTATPITDFINYPNVPTAAIPASCKVDGANVLKGVSFIVNHNGTNTTGTDLSAFTLVVGDKVTMNWTDYTPGCENLGISFAVKATQHPTFVPQDDQHLVSFAFCSGTDCGTANDFGHLTITIPPKEAACNFQLDAVIGPPLNNVGPNGSYYSNASRQAATPPKASGPNMLIAANNGGVGKCTLPPRADAVVTCAMVNGSPGADIAITNPDDDDIAHVNILKGTTVVASNVAVGTLATVHQLVPFGSGETATLSVVDVLTGTTVYTERFTADCLNPAAVALKNCAAGGVDIDLTNSKPGTAHFTVTVGSKSTTYDVTSTTAKHFTEPVAEGATVVITITEATAGVLVDHLSFTMDCFKPSAKIENSCAEGGVLVTFTNTGSVPADLKVTKNGSAIDTVTVAVGKSVFRTYPMAEDETATFRVTGTNFDSGDQQIIHDCIDAATTTTVPPTTEGPSTTPPTVQGTEVVRAATLPRTGAGSTAGLSATAGILLVLGGVLMALSNRPVPMMATASMRSRGR
ncbi:MAG: hypothetical protein QOC92_846 [Acidimicrobiaceae bacterium]